MPNYEMKTKRSAKLLKWLSMLMTGFIRGILTQTIAATLSRTDIMTFHSQGSKHCVVGNYSELFSSESVLDRLDRMKPSQRIWFWMIYANKCLFLLLFFYNLTSAMIFLMCKLFWEEVQLQKARKERKIQDPQTVNMKLHVSSIK